MKLKFKLTLIKRIGMIILYLAIVLITLLLTACSCKIFKSDAGNSKLSEKISFLITDTRLVLVKNDKIRTYKSDTRIPLLILNQIETSVHPCSIFRNKINSAFLNSFYGAFHFYRSQETILYRNFA